LAWRPPSCGDAVWGDIKSYDELAGGMPDNNLTIENYREGLFGIDFENELI
jgi:hypothetical protein